MALVSVGAGFGAVGNRTYRMEVIEMPLLPVDWLRGLCDYLVGWEVASAIVMDSDSGVAGVRR
jgi:hypothetical protein